MAEYTAYEGNIVVIDDDVNCYIVILNNFVGEFYPDSSIQSLTFKVLGNCEIENDIVLVNTDNSDMLRIRGQGKCSFKKLQATYIKIEADCSVSSISSNVTSLSGGRLELSGESEASPNILCSGHMWIIDSVMTVNNSINEIIESPFVLIDNSKCKLSSQVNVFSENCFVNIEHCDDVVSEESLFECSPHVTETIDGELVPKNFIINNNYDSQGRLESTDSRLINLAQGQAVIADDYQEFVDSQQYTNPWLHRRIDQESEPVHPDTVSPKYEIGVYSLNSYRTTVTSYYSDSLDNMLP